MKKKIARSNSKQKIWLFKCNVYVRFDKLSIELHVDYHTINTYSTWKLNMQLTRHCYTSMDKELYSSLGASSVCTHPVEVHVQISAHLFMYKGCNVKTQNKKTLCR